MDAVVDSPTTTAQKRFDTQYITSAEICEEMGVCRTTVLQAKKRGLLPDPVMVGNVVLIWERASVRPALDAWKVILGVKSNTLGARASA